jgi:hypothetical protein
MSINSLIHYNDKLLNAANPGNCTLLLDLADARGNIAIINSADHKLLFLASAERAGEANLKDLVFKLKELLPVDPGHFGDARLLFYNSAFEIVPAEWYMHEDRDHYLLLQQKESSTFPTNVNKVTPLELYILAAVPFNVKLAMDAFNTIFGLYHAAAVFISAYLDAYADKKASAKKIFCNYFTSGIEILVPEKDKLGFYNQLTVSDPMEAVFFILNTIHSLELNHDFNIVFTGDVTPKSDMIAALKKALPDVAISLATSENSKKLRKTTKLNNPLAFEHIFQLMKCE